MAQNIFERYEKKYLISKPIQEIFLKRISDKVEQDRFGCYTISNIYYDTWDYSLIRKSMERPVYKEKLRIRSYGKADESSEVYIELKKKYKGVVYKRRIGLSYQNAKEFLETGALSAENNQIAREIQYFIRQYPVREKLFLSCDRKAFKGTYDNELRITFDTNISFRQHNLSLSKESSGKSIFGPNEALMEIKFVGAMPVWLSRELSELCIFPTSFSKYGTCYKNYILTNKEEEKEVVQSA